MSDEINPKTDEERELVQAWIASYNDPVLFVRKLLGVEPYLWQEKGLKAMVTHDRVSIASGHGVGKTTFCAWVVLWFLLTRYPCKIPITANSADQLIDVTFSEIASWARRLPPVFQVQVDWAKERIWLKARPDECFAVARTASKDRPEAFQGFHSVNLLFISDEASGVPEKVYEIGLGAMSTPGAKQLLLGNMTRRTGYFYRTHYGNNEGWYTDVVSSETIPNATGHIKEIIANYGEDSDEYRVRVLGLPPSSDDEQLIKDTVIEKAKSRVLVKSNYPLVFGVDVATKEGKDFSVIYPRRGWDAASIPFVRIRNIDNMSLAARIAAMAQQYKPEQIFIDYGMGQGVIDRLSMLNVPCIGVWFGGKPDNVMGGFGFAQEACFNKRAEMYRTLQRWLEQGGKIPNEKEHEDARHLYAELAGIATKPADHNQKLQLEAKSRLIKSPDISDALALTFAYPVYMEEVDYDPNQPLWLRNIERKLKTPESKDYHPYAYLDGDY